MLLVAWGYMLHNILKDNQQGFLTAEHAARHSWHNLAVPSPGRTPSRGSPAPRSPSVGGKASPSPPPSPPPSLPSPPSPPPSPAAATSGAAGPSGGAAETRGFAPLLSEANGGAGATAGKRLRARSIEMAQAAAPSAVEMATAAVASGWHVPPARLPAPPAPRSCLGSGLAPAWLLNSRAQES